jgi:hypothetical protein
MEKDSTSYNIILPEFLPKFPYSLMGIITKKDKIVNNVIIGILIGEDIVLSVDNDKEEEKNFSKKFFTPFRTGDLNIFNPIKIIGEKKIIIKNNLNITVYILSENIGKNIVDFMEIKDNEKNLFSIENNLFGFFRDNIDFFEENLYEIIKNGFYENKLFILSYIKPGKYFSNENYSDRETSESSNRASSANMEKNYIENNYFLMKEYFYNNKLDEFGNHCFYNNNSDFLLSKIQIQNSKINKNNNLNYKKIHLNCGSPIFIKYKKKIYLIGLHTKFAEKINNQNNIFYLFNDNENLKIEEKSIGIILTKEIYNNIIKEIEILKNKKKLMKIEKYFFENLFNQYYLIKIFNNNNIILKGIFNKNMLLDVFLSIFENILNIPSGFISMEIKTNEKNKIFKSKDVFFYNTLENLLKFNENNSVQFNIYINIDVDIFADNLIKSFKIDKNFEKIEKEKDKNKIIEYVVHSLEFMKDKKENYFIHQLLLTRIIQKLTLNIE